MGTKVCPTNFLLPINATSESSKHYPKLSENFYLTIQLIHPPYQSNLGVIQHCDKVAATRSLPIFVMFFHDSNWRHFTIHIPQSFGMTKMNLKIALK